MNKTIKLPTEHVQPNVQRLTGQRIAVTGGTGMVGSHLVAELLKLECRVKLLVRPGGGFGQLEKRLQQLQTAQYAAQLECCEVPLNNPLELGEALQNIDVVFNCAARVSFDTDEQEQIIISNTEIATQVALACLENKVGLLVHVSSVATLGSPKPGCDEVTESCELTSLKERSPYSVSKFFAENAVRRAALRGLRTVVVNPSVIIGEGDWNRGSGLLVSTLVSKGTPAYPSGVMGYVDVRDVMQAMLLLAVCDGAVGKRFILSGGNLSYKELFTMIAKAVGRRPPLIPVGSGALHTLAHIQKIFGAEQLNDTLIHVAIDQVRYDGSAVCRLTGMHYTPLDETINRVVKQYLQDRADKK